MLHTFKVIMKSGAVIELHAKHLIVRKQMGSLVEVEWKGCMNVNVMYLDLNEVAAITQTLIEGPDENGSYPQENPHSCG